MNLRVFGRDDYQTVLADVAAGKGPVVLVNFYADAFKPLDKLIERWTDRKAVPDQF